MQGSGTATTSSGHPKGLGAEVGVMRPLKGRAASASLPVHPCPECLSNRKGRRGRKLAQHRSCRLSGCVLLLTSGGQSMHLALAPHLSPPGDTADPCGTVEL